MITENISTLKIHKLTQAQYERELNAGNIDSGAIYLTPDEGIISSNGTIIPQNADLNTYTTYGNYYSESSTKSKTIANCPITTSGFKMIVMHNYSNSCPIQMIFAYGNSFWYRSYTHNNSVWSEWVNVAHQVDSNMSTTSTNPVQNKVVQEAITTAVDSLRDEIQSDFELNYKIYSSMEQIGLSGAMTTADVFAAMPNQSVLLFSNNKDASANYLSDVPVTYSAIELKKDTNWGRAKAVRISATVPEFYEANWSTSNGFSGWVKNVSYTNTTKNSVIAELGVLNIGNVANSAEFVIASGDNLDTYTTSGVFISSNSSITSSLSNAPRVSAGFRLIVSTGTASSTAMQIAIANDEKGTIFFRNKKTNSTTWSPWEKILRNVFTSSEYGSSLPSTGAVGQVYFLKG